MPKLPAHRRMLLSFDPEKHYLWPIPQSEIDNNELINQADQNPGY